MPSGRAPDPLQVAFKAGARRLLDRVYDNPYQWQVTRLTPPTPGQTAALRQRGIDPYKPDPVQKGGLDAKTRWARGFVRTLYHEHKWWSGTGGRGWRTERRTTARTTGGLLVEVGRVMPARGIIPAGRIVRVRLAPGGKAKEKAVDRLPDRAKWADGGPQRAQEAWRDW